MTLKNYKERSHEPVKLNGFVGWYCTKNINYQTAWNLKNMASGIFLISQVFRQWILVQFEIKGVCTSLYHWKMFPTVCLKYLVLFCSCIISHYFCSQGFLKTWFVCQRDKNTPDTCRFHLEKHQKIHSLSWNLLLILSARCQFENVLWRNIFSLVKHLQQY